jgi:tRNA threonylcarbamoyladenosine biosynthesis protein TsaB
VKLLALEAGGPLLSAALFEDSVPVGEAWLRAPQRQTEQLAPLVDALLREHRWRAADLDALACGRGPGSFTGLRSSMAFGAGLALAGRGLRLWPVATLRAWAEAFCPAETGQALVLLDGRRSQVYRGLLRRREGSWEDVLKPTLMDLSAALVERAAAPSAALIVDFVPLDGMAAAPPRPDSAALALAVGRLALRALGSGSVAPPWEPEYLRRSEAEILWERLHPSAAKGDAGHA